RSHRYSPRVFPARDLLSLHFLLCAGRLQTQQPAHFPALAADTALASKGGLAYQSWMWSSNKITAAANGTARPLRRLPVAFEITPTIHGSTAGPSDAKVNITDPMLRAATPKRCEKRATVMGYKMAKLNPVMSVAAVTPGRVDDHSISPIPAVAVAKPTCSTRRSGRCFRIRPADARPNISADQKKAGIMGPIAAPRAPIRATYEPIQPPTAVSAPG